MSVHPSVRNHLLFRRFQSFASGSRITAPAQLHATDAVVYNAPPTVPVHHITAPAQPRATNAVVYTALFHFWLVVGLRVAKSSGLCVF